MKKIISAVFPAFACVIFMSAAQQAQAQGPPPKQVPTAQEMADRDVAQMKNDLALSTEQVEKVKPIALKYAQKRKDIMEANKGADREVIKTKMQALDKEMDAELDDVLTADQMTKLQSVRNKRAAAGPGGARP